MVRIALVPTPLGGPSAQVPPLGCMALGSFLVEELGTAIECKIFDFVRDRPRLLDELSHFKPDIIGMPVYSGHVDDVVNLARLAKQRLPHALLVAGGPHVTLTWLDFIHRWGSLFDYCVNGDGEFPLLAIVQATLSKDWRSCHAVAGVGRKTRLGPAQQGPAMSLPADRWVNPFLCDVVSDNDTLYFTDRRDHKRRRAVALVSSRSCPLKCSFCAIIAMPGKWRAAPVQMLMQWLRKEWEKNPFEHIYFMDANYFVSPKRVKELADEITRAFPDVTWSTSSTVGYFLKMEDDIPWLIAHGLRSIELGLESGSPEQLAFLNKQATSEQNLRSVSLIQKHGLGLGLDFIMFYPDQSLSGLQENLVFLHDANLLDEEYSDHYYTALELYPGTPLRTFYEKRRGTPFMPDEMPEIGDMFIDPTVREIHRLFVQQYAPRYRERNENLVKAWRQRALCLQERPAQQLRLASIRLHHLPYRLLRALITAPPGRLIGMDIDAYWPWLAQLDAHPEILLGMPSQIAAPPMMEEMA